MIRRKKTFPKKLQSFSEATINSLIQQLQAATSGTSQLNAKVKRTYVDPSRIGNA